MVLIIDHYDSFIDMISDYVRRITPQLHLVKSDQVSPELVQSLAPQQIIIGPGPGHPLDPTLAATRAALASAIQQRIPVLGICLGHQLIAAHYQAQIVTAAQIAHGLVSQIEVLAPACRLFASLPQQFAVTRYHSLLVAPHSLNTNQLRVTATSRCGEVMALAHRQLPIYGVQFHPESILTEYGSPLLENFLSLTSACSVR